MNMPSSPNDFNNLVSPELKTTSRIIAERFDKEHYAVLRAIRDLIDKNPEWGAVNFASFKINDLTGESTSHYEMTRDGYTMLVMGFTGRKAMEWKIKFLEAFNAMEKKLKEGAGFPAALSGPQLMAAALIEADATMKAQQAQIQSMQEDVEAFDRIAKADGSFCVSDAAKSLQMRQTDLFKWLRENGWIYKRPGAKHDLGYQPKISSGLLEHKTTTVLQADGSERIKQQVRVTGKGLSKLAKLIPPAARQIGGEA